MQFALSCWILAILYPSTPSQALTLKSRSSSDLFLPIYILHLTKGVTMSSVDTITSSAQAVCDILKNAQAKTLEQATKQMELTITMSVGKEIGKGSQTDIVA